MLCPAVRLCQPLVVDSPGLVELLLPMTTPTPGQEWTADALLRDAKPPRHDHSGGCCGHSHGDSDDRGHRHGEAHERAATAPTFSDAEVALLLGVRDHPADHSVPV